MTTALARREVTPDTWKMIQAVTPTIYKARLFGVGSEEQAAAIMLKGHELGLSLTSSFEFIHIIEGKPSINPRGMLALIYQCGELEGIRIEDDGKTCKVWMKRRSGVEYTATFSDDDAKRAGLVKDKSGWEKYPKQMRQWRAVGFCADVVFPDILSMKRADEYGADLTPEGDVIEGSWMVAPVAAVDKPAPQPDPTKLLNELVHTHGAEAVMAANGGKIPSTLAEMELVRDKLANPDVTNVEPMEIDQ